MTLQCLVTVYYRLAVSMVLIISLHILDSNELGVRTASLEPAHDNSMFLSNTGTHLPGYTAA
jgi:hypothetical protein